MKIFTIGVYNSSEEQFFKKLTDNDIDTFCDIRQRRGVRGSKYSFANSTYLQARLADLGVKYIHIAELAPTNEIRDKQKEEDKRRGEHKRDRNKLGQVFADEYIKQIIRRFDFDAFVRHLKDIKAANVALLCVEEKAEACHRSIVAAEMKKRYNTETIDL
ncbi:MAG: DUF488 domain-containing protein [Prevotella sp.]|nr:DUF488 domain-containing protein [Prevotella sp.]